MKNILFIALALIMLLSVCVTASAAGIEYDVPLKGEPTDYSNMDNWYLYNTNPDREVDLIYLYPTVAMGEETIGQIDDAMKAAAAAVYQKQGAAIGELTNVFVPYYRQLSMTGVYAVMDNGGFSEEIMEAIQTSEARTDVYAALDYYFENANNGRPFILAGHSQGSTLCVAVLQEYLRLHPDYLERMVACYALGTGFTQEWQKANPHIQFAEGETDTGVVICWNTEGPDATEPNFCALPGAYAINPLTWTTDETTAPVTLNKGSLEYNEETGMNEIVAGKGDATVDKERGVIVCTTYAQYATTIKGVGDKCLHGEDWGLYFANIRENAQKRIEAYLAKEKASMATDYTKAENWAVYESDGTEQVDTIFFCPSLVFSSVTGTGLALPEEMLPGIDTVLKGQAAVFEDSTNVYVPLYRQQVFNAEVLSAMDMSDPVHWMFEYYRTHAAYEDCAAALDYYFENCNNGKPFILAGHSQGSILVHLILEKYMAEHPEYYERMVAAYAIGMSTPKDFMEANPHLKYATGADDTGVIISYNTEGPDAEGTNFLLCEGSYLINPINWKTDDTYAPAEDNLGSYVDGEIVMNFADAQIDFERYAIVSTADCSYGEMVAYTGTKCLHGSDYQIYMNNLKENVKVRIEAFLAQ